MAQETDNRLVRLVEQMRQRPGLPDELPPDQGDVVEAALEGQDIHTIASEKRMDEGAVWRILEDAARWAAGTPPRRTDEQAGLGSDTEPGIHGGYGETGFGSLGNEPPAPPPEEPPFKRNRPASQR